jgi:hypothetical protein
MLLKPCGTNDQFIAHLSFFRKWLSEKRSKRGEAKFRVNNKRLVNFALIDSLRSASVQLFGHFPARDLIIKNKFYVDSPNSTIEDVLPSGQGIKLSSGMFSLLPTLY